MWRTQFQQKSICHITIAGKPLMQNGLETDLSNLGLPQFMMRNLPIKGKNQSINF